MFIYEYIVRASQSCFVFEHGVIGGARGRSNISCHKGSMAGGRQEFNERILDKCSCRLTHSCTILLCNGPWRIAGPVLFKNCWIYGAVMMRKYGDGQLWRWILNTLCVHIFRGCISVYVSEYDMSCVCALIQCIGLLKMCMWYLMATLATSMDDWSTSVE